MNKSLRVLSHVSKLVSRLDEYALSNIFISCSYGSKSKSEPGIADGKKKEISKGKILKVETKICVI